MLQHPRSLMDQHNRSHVNPFKVFLSERRYENHLPSPAQKARHAGQQVVSRAVNAAEPVLDCAPAFDEPPRMPTDAEARAIAAGSKLTPEQQLAKQLELPVTLRIKLHPGRPTDRQLMGQIQAAATWKELEAVVYQQRTPPAALQKPAAPTDTPAQQLATAAAERKDETQINDPSAVSQGQQEKQRGASSQSLRQQPRRRQQPKPLSVQPRPASAGSPSSSAPTAATATSGASSPSTDAPLPPPAAAAAAAPGGYLKPSPLLNHLHVTEAIRRLNQLLPKDPRALNPEERTRAAVLIDFLTQQATALAYALEIDARGIAHIALSLSKLGHKDKALVQEFQEAALLLVRDFNSRYMAMLLGALVGLKVQPDSDLLAAIKQQISHTLHQYTHQSLANTIWALAKLSSIMAVQITATSVSSTTAVQGIDQRLLADLARRCDPQMHIWSPVHLAQTVWGLGRLKAKPDEKWCQSVLKATYCQLSKMGPQDLANVITGLPELGALPSQIWLDAFCTTAAAKMKFADALGLYSMLFGLAKVKQLHRKVIIKAEKRRQRRQQQQQQQQEQQQEHDAASAQKEQQQEPNQQQGLQAQAYDDLVHQQDQDIQQQQPSESGVERCSSLLEPALSAAEVKFMCAVAMWLDRQLDQLAHWQLAGVVISLSQLLPADIIQHDGVLHQHQQQQQQQQQLQQQQQQQQMVSDGQQNRADSYDQDSPDHDQKQQIQKGNRPWLSEEEHLELKRQRLVASVSSVLPRLAVQQEEIASSLPKKQARLFKVAWKRLWQLSNNSDSGGASG